MRRMMSPKPNRKGEYEVHSVSSRMAARMSRQGWTEVPEGVEDKPLTESLSNRRQFNLSGPWLKVRSEVRRELGINRLPESKSEARYLLEDAGYEVVED